MTMTQGIYILVTILWSLTILQGLLLLRAGLRLLRYVSQSIAGASTIREADGRFKYQPRAAVILPCCGVDERLHHTVESLSRQNYADYEIIFTFESTDDPAYAAVKGWTAGWSRQSPRLVVAGLAQHRGQKVHNLLAALPRVSPDREVFVFLDSDAVPGTDWLGFLIAPLADPRTGAATGFRWYSAAGGLANGLRSCWNAASLTLITDPTRNFVWGGSTAIRRQTFERLRIAQRWDRALSDDYQVSRALHEAGLSIRFVPQALVPSHEPTDFKSFWAFARRQVVITRVCGPAIWRHALLLCLNFVVGGTAVAMLFLAALVGWIGDARVMWLALAGWSIICAVASFNALLRQRAIRQVLRPPDLGWRDFVWDVFGVNLSGMLHLALMLSSTTSRRIIWRNTEYELLSPDETRIIRRIDRPPSWASASTRPGQAAGVTPPP